MTSPPLADRRPSRNPDNALVGAVKALDSVGGRAMLAFAQAGYPLRRQPVYTGAYVALPL